MEVADYDDFDEVIAHLVKSAVPIEDGVVWDEPVSPEDALLYVLWVEDSLIFHYLLETVREGPL